MSRIVLPAKDLTKPKKRTRKTVDQKNAKELIKVADKYFSQYVRLRDCDKGWDGETGYWRGQCITCSKAGVVAYLEDGKLKFSKGWDAGHFIGRSNKVVRYNEMNVNLQCAFRCNKMRSGEYQKYRKALKDKYGYEVPRELEELAQDTPYYKLTKVELLQVIEDSKTQIDFYANHS